MSAPDILDEAEVRNGEPSDIITHEYMEFSGGQPRDQTQNNNSVDGKNKMKDKYLVWILKTFGLSAFFEALVLIAFAVTIVLLSTQSTPSSILSGITYVRWGRTECPNTAHLVYSGIAGGSYFEDTGSGANLLCLPNDPEYVIVQEGEQAERARIYSTEYELSDTDLHNHEVPCAVCTVPHRGRKLMIPAKVTCPANWTSEYRGYLMAEYFQRGEYICVDEFAEGRPGGSSGNEDGGLLARVEGRCTPGNLPCPAYINGNELTCVVCSI
ncbi:uncharacterized protein [Amphiura filiformis]|uniref:uncharacterized protein n=1 Tax=Amphiura filiformis TaxID=82378 RepID=UPI003B20C236